MSAKAETAANAAPSIFSASWNDPGVAVGTFTPLARWVTVASTWCQAPSFRVRCESTPPAPARCRPRPPVFVQARATPPASTKAMSIVEPEDSLTHRSMERPSAVGPAAARLPCTASSTPSKWMA